MATGWPGHHAGRARVCWRWTAAAPAVAAAAAKCMHEARQPTNSLRFPPRQSRVRLAQRPLAAHAARKTIHRALPGLHALGVALLVETLKSLFVCKSLFRLHTLGFSAVFGYQHRAGHCRQLSSG